ncbi:MAG TPA: hypothetical protein VIF62_19250 [Labilithrix sp.]
MPAAPSFPDRKTLTRTDRRVVRAIAQAMFAQDGDASAERLDAHVDEVDAYVSAASKTLRLGLRVALFVVRIAPILFFVRARTIERVSIDERVAILARLERSSFTAMSLAFVGWRTVMTLLFYEHPSELAAIGYSDRRERHKRLPIAPPIPTESGVRLTGASDPPSEKQEVA